MKVLPAVHIWEASAGSTSSAASRLNPKKGRHRHGAVPNQEGEGGADRRVERLAQDAPRRESLQAATRGVVEHSMRAAPGAVHIWEASGRLDVERGLEAESEKGRHRRGAAVVGEGTGP
jgi:hypothetical protein